MAIVDLTDMKDRLEIADASAEDDDFLALKADEIEAILQDETGRVLARADYTETRYRPTLVLLRDAPVVSISSVVADGTTLSAGDDGYLVDTERGKLYRTSGGIPSNWDGIEKLELSYRAGFTAATLPPGIRKLVDDYVADAWNRRGAAGSAAAAAGRSNIARQALVDVGSVDFVQPSTSPDAERFVGGVPLSRAVGPFVRRAHWIPSPSLAEVSSWVAAP